MLEMKVPLTWTAGVAVIIAIVIAAALLFGDRRQTVQAQAYVVSKNLVDTVMAPASNALATPGRWTGEAANGLSAYVIAGTQNRALREQIIDLRRWRDQAIALQNENARLRALLGLETDPPIPMVTAHVIADSHGPFADTRLADAGAEKGLAVGNPVMSERGLVGRVVGVGRGVSRVLLLTDIVSRTPVLIDRTNARAILAGDGGPNPKLSYMRGQDPVKAGDRVLTSGDGGVFPRGLPVGVAVQGLDGSWRVRLDSDNAPVDYVRILKFTDFSRLADDKALSNATIPPLAPKDAAAIAAQEAAPLARGGAADHARPAPPMRPAPTRPVPKRPVAAKAKPVIAAPEAEPAVSGSPDQ